MLKVGYQIQHQSNVRVRIDKHWETRTATQPIKQRRRKRVIEQNMRIHDKYGETRMYIVFEDMMREGMLIRTLNKFSLSLCPSASDSQENTKSESQKVPLSSLNVQQTSTGRPVLGASSSNSSEWNNDDKWSSQVRRTGVHPIKMCGGTSKMCTDNFCFFVQCPLSCCRFHLQSITIHCNRRRVWTHVRILSICERPAGR